MLLKHNVGEDNYSTSKLENALQLLPFLEALEVPRTSDEMNERYLTDNFHTVRPITNRMEETILLVTWIRA